MAHGRRIKWRWHCTATGIPAGVSSVAVSLPGGVILRPLRFRPAVSAVRHCAPLYHTQFRTTGEEFRLYALRAVCHKKCVICLYTKGRFFFINPTGASQQPECAPGGLCIACAGRVSAVSSCLLWKIRGAAGAVALFSVRCPAVPVCRFGLSCSVILLQRRNPFTRKNT